MQIIGGNAACETLPKPLQLCMIGFSLLIMMCACHYMSVRHQSTGEAVVGPPAVACIYDDNVKYRMLAAECHGQMVL